MCTWIEAASAREAPTPKLAAAPCGGTTLNQNSASACQAAPRQSTRDDDQQLGRLTTLLHPRAATAIPNLQHFNFDAVSCDFLPHPPDSHQNRPIAPPYIPATDKRNKRHNALRRPKNDHSSLLRAGRRLPAGDPLLRAMALLLPATRGGDLRARACAQLDLRPLRRGTR